MYRGCPKNPKYISQRGAINVLVMQILITHFIIYKEYRVGCKEPDNKHKFNLKIEFQILSLNG